MTAATTLDSSGDAGPQYKKQQHGGGGGAVSALSFDPSTIEFTSIKERDNKSKVVWMYSLRQKIYLELPKMQTPFGIEKYDTKESGTVYSLKLSFGPEYNVSGTDDNRIFEIFKKIDERIIQAAKANSKEWFKRKELTNDFIQEKYFTLIKWSTKLVKDGDTDVCVVNEDYPPTLRFRLDIDPTTNQFRTCFNNLNREEINIGPDNFESRIPKRSSLRSVIELSSIWFSQMGFGVTSRLNTALVYPQRQGFDLDYFKKRTYDDEQTQETTASLTEPNDDEMLVDDEIAVEETLEIHDSMQKKRRHD